MTENSEHLQKSGVNELLIPGSRIDRSKTIRYKKTGGKLMTPVSGE
jgi:hypothetical protein